MAKVDLNLIVELGDIEAARSMIETLSDAEVIALYDLTGGEGDLADLAAAQMELRNLDY